MVFNSCECVLMCGIQMSVHAHVSDQVDTQCFLVLLFGSLCKLGEHPGRLGVQGAPGSLLPLSACSSVTGIIHYYIQLLWGCWEPASSPYVCVVSTLLTH